MATTRKRQLSLLVLFMFIFAVLFFYCMFDKHMGMMETLVGCGVTGCAFVVLANSYIDVMKR